MIPLLYHDRFRRQADELLMLKRHLQAEGAVAYLATAVTLVSYEHSRSANESYLLTDELAEILE